MLRVTKPTCHNYWASASQWRSLILQRRSLIPQWRSLMPQLRLSTATNKQMKKLWRFHKKLKTAPVWSNSSTPGHIPREKHGYLHPSDHWNTVYNSQDMEAPQMSIDRWMDKEDVMHIYNGILCCAMLCLVAQSYLALCDLMDCSLPGSYVRGDSPGMNTGVGCYALLQGFFPTQRWIPGLLHCRQILYRLSHQRSPQWNSTEI